MRAPRILKGIFPILIMLFVFSFAGIACAGVPTQVVVNKSVLLDLKNSTERVSVANPAIADIILITPRQIQLNGLAIGSTSLIVWEKGEQRPAFFDINVVGDMSQLEPQIKELSPNDSINVEYAKDTIILSGKATNDQTVAKVVQVSKAYAPNVLNHIQIDDPQQVVLQVKVAQVDKTALKKLGISGLVKGKTAEGFYNTIVAPNGGATGSTSTTGTGGSSSSVGSGTGISGNVPGLGSINPLDAFTAGVSYFPGGVGAVLQALTTKNLAKILAEPNLLVKSGQKGEFLAGSKIPYNIVTSTGGTATTSIYFVDVGVKLYFAPEVMENGKIALKIDPAEVSTIQGTLQVNGYPIIDTRSVKTNVELKDGESLVLAGLLSENTIKTMSKIPLLGDIPILGALFRSTSDDLEQKELVFFITPKLVKAMAPGTKPDLPSTTPEQEKELKWMPTGN
ncbi:MAG TPA: pilus assembly protein N-terminal domain-containing protein [Geobacteraceae bacterium]